MQKGGGGTQFFDRVQQNAEWRAHAKASSCFINVLHPDTPETSVKQLLVFSLAIAVLSTLPCSATTMMTIVMKPNVL